MSFAGRGSGHGVLLLQGVDSGLFGGFGTGGNVQARPGWNVKLWQQVMSWGSVGFGQGV